MPFGEKETHESYGIIGLSRRSSSPPTNLFGSSVKHSQFMSLTIKTCEKERHLNRDRYYGRDTIVEIDISPVQFAEMLTGVGIGDGVPCTITYRSDKGRIEQCPEISQRQIFENEFKKEMKEITSTCYGDLKEVDEILLRKGTITKGEREKVSGIINKIVSKISNTLPFVQSSFNEAMDKTIIEAKGEVDAFVTNKVHSLGIEAMKDQLLQLSETTEKE